MPAMNYFLIISLKGKIQQFMLCLKGKIHRKILVILKFLNINYKITTNFILSLKDKIQGFMLCLKGKIPRKIMVTLIFQEDVIAKIKMYKILYIKG
jgi:hypothetical protein